jgi:hypothetical protein
MIKTGDDGKGIINLRLNDAWYRYQVVYNNIVYLTTTASKETATSRTLRIFLTQINPYLQFNNIAYTLTFNNVTNAFVLTYGDTTGSVEIACLKVSQIENNEVTPVSTTCVQSSSGTVSYSVMGNGTFVGEAEFRLNSIYSNAKTTLQKVFAVIGLPARFTTMGTFGYVAALLLIGTLAMIGVASGSIILGLVLVIAGSIFSFLLGLLNLGGVVLYSLAGIALVIGFISSRRFG